MKKATVDEEGEAMNQAFASMMESEEAAAKNKYAPLMRIRAKPIPLPMELKKKAPVQIMLLNRNHTMAPTLLAKPREEKKKA